VYRRGAGLPDGVAAAGHRLCCVVQLGRRHARRGPKPRMLHSTALLCPLLKIYISTTVLLQLQALDPSLTDAHLLLASIGLARGDTKAAAAALEQAPTQMQNINHYHLIFYCTCRRWLPTSACKSRPPTCACGLRC
jgi:hypothetical protein